MRKNEFSALGGPAACLIKGVKSTREVKDLLVVDFSVDEPKRYFCRDSWYGSVKSMANIVKTSHHAVMIIKIYHSCTPKKWLESSMSYIPRGL